MDYLDDYYNDNSEHVDQEWSFYCSENQLGNSDLAFYRESIFWEFVEDLYFKQLDKG